MSKFKKLSFILIFACLALASFVGFNFKVNSITRVEAIDEKIVLNVRKVKYTNDLIVDENGIVKTLGEYTSKELYNNLDAIVKNSEKIESGCATSIKPEENEAVLVSLMPSDNTSSIKFLTASLVVASNGKQSNILVEPYKVDEESEKRIFIMAFDFTKLKTIGEDFDYSMGAHLNFSFNYSYTTNGTNVISETKSADFYLIDNEKYFGESNKYVIKNYLQTENDVYYFNKSKD
ncbi:MAG: hypothetical protein ACI4TI_02090, partial [Christensenellales bacterium]